MATDPCGRCGQPHVTWRGGKACNGHISPGSPGDEPKERVGQACGNLPMRGQRVCAKHGGRSPHNLAAAARRLERESAEALMVTLGEPVADVDPSEIIAERLAVRFGHVRWLLSRVRALEPDALTWGLTKRKTTVGDTAPDDTEDGDAGPRRRFAGTDEGDTHEAKPHIWYTLYVEAARDLEKLCIEAKRVGFEERRVHLAEAQGALIAEVIRGILDDLDLTAEQSARVPEIVPRRLRLVV